MTDQPPFSWLDSGRPGHPGWIINNREVPQDPQQALYVDAVKNAMLGVVLPWLTTVCPECGLDLLEYGEEAQGDHVMLGQFVIVGCEGYLIVNPNAVGIFRMNWHDWRGDANELPQT